MTSETFNGVDWDLPFSRNTAVATTTHVLEGRLPVLYVERFDSSKVPWQMVDYVEATSDETLAIAHLHHVLALDSTLGDLLRVIEDRWFAIRDAVGGEWRSGRLPLEGE